MVKKLVAGLSALLLTLLPVAGLTGHAAAALTNPVGNPSVATAGALNAEYNVIQPTGWAAQSWTSIAGAITPKFEYVTNDGHGDSTSVKVTMSNYEKTYSAGEGGQGGVLSGDDGDAKWVFDALPVVTANATGTQLQVGKQYRFSTWYKSNVAPKVVVDYIQADGSERFFGMPNPKASAASSWTQYSDTFSIPQGTTAVTVFMFLDQNGWMQTDDYSISDYTPTGFSEGLLTMTYDDGHEDNVANLLPLLAEYGYKTTQCFETITLQTEAATQANLKAFQNAGHEVCSHTVSHPMLTKVSASQLTTELNSSKSFLENAAGVTVPNFASPYGDYNEAVVNAIKAAGYTSHRTVDEGYNSKDNYDPYRLRVQNIFYDDATAGTKTTTAAQVAAWIAQAKADKTWLVLVYHRVVDTTQAGVEAPGPYDTSKAMMREHLEAIKASGIKVQTMAEALANTKAQIDGTTTPPVVKPGDANGDNLVNIKDATLVSLNWGKTGVTRAQGDLNGDGSVNIKDATLVSLNWSK